LILLVAPLILAGFALPQQEKPITKEQLVNALRQLRPGDAQSAVINRIRRRGVDFELTATVETELRTAGARQPLLTVVRNSFRPPQPPPKPTPRQKQIMNAIGIEFVWVTPESFMMGSEKGQENEKPVHRVTILNGYYIGKYEVTQEQWQKVMKNNPSQFKGENLPVEGVTWEAAQEFIRRLNAMKEGYEYRLPTEAEWEYACRAGTTGDYLDDLDATGWYGANSSGQTHTVGSKEPNAFGLFDMHGNVWEMCQDDCHDNYMGAPLNGSAWLVAAGADSPKVLRGGSWFDEKKLSSSTVRICPDNFADHGNKFGVRIVAVARAR